MTLEQVVRDWREDAAVLRRQGQGAQAESIETLLDAVQESAREYVLWITEADAMLRSGRTARWLRGEFPQWERQGHARIDAKNKRKRWYRMLIVPCRANTSAAYEAGARAAEEESAR